jgi:glycosyltransferase involved in cell wall biosynthesis
MSSEPVSAPIPAAWDVPAHRVEMRRPWTAPVALVIPVLNEEEKLHAQLRRLDPVLAALGGRVDVVLVDGGSTDGTLRPEGLGETVAVVLHKTGPGRLSAQLRLGMAWALAQGCEAVLTMDGNGKDGVEGLPRILAALDAGADMVQGSRFVPGGEAVRTPKDRERAVKWIHAPAIRFASGFPWTDTTNGFRGHSARLLRSPDLAIFRDVFARYNLHYYMSVEAPRHGFRCVEVPVRRAYPEDGSVPSKIGGWRGKAAILGELAGACLGVWRPTDAERRRAAEAA